MECETDWACPTNMECEADRCVCVWTWGMTGDRCEVLTARSAVVLTTRGLIILMYMPPLVFVVKLLLYQYRLGQKCNFDYMFTTLVWVLVSSVLAPCYQAAKLLVQGGLLQNSRVARPLLSLMEGVYAICAILSFVK